MNKENIDITSQKITFDLHPIKNNILYSTVLNNL